MISSFQMTTTIDFQQWLQHEIDERQWNQSDLARHSGLSTGHISRLILGRRNPGKETCRSIARAFRVPIDIVLREAGILPISYSPKDGDSFYQRIMELPGDMREQVEDYMDFLQSRKANEKQT